MFGIARLPAKRATGTVVFTRSGPTTSALTIPYNTVIRSNTTPAQDFILVAPAIIAIGQTTASAPVQAVTAGAIGNLGPATLTLGGNLPPGVTVTNLVATSGGTEPETDGELRLRWKRTVFRSLSGTEQMYVGIGLNDPDVRAANVVTGSKRVFEQLQVATAAATSQVQDIKYVFADNVSVGLDLDAGQIYLKGVDYTWAASIPPVITILNTTGITDGTLLQAEYEYTSTASRNDPTNGVMHRIDLWLSGVRSKSAVQVVAYRASLVFNTTGGSAMNRDNFIRLDGTKPTSGNIFIPLNFGPIIDVPDILSIGGDTYGLVGSGATVDFPDAYRIVHDDTAFGYAASSRFGLEWDSTKQPATNAVFTVGENDSYLYNEIPLTVQSEINRWRLLGIDALAHQAKTISLRFNVAIIYTGNIATSAVNTAIDAALATYVSGLGFAQPVQFSDVLQVIHNVPGVDAVRFLHGADHLSWNPLTPNAFAVGIQQVINGVVVKSFVDTNGRAKDVLFGDNEVAGFESCYRVAKAQNTFGVG
jgi:hypothetical protein